MAERNKGDRTQFIKTYFPTLYFDMSDTKR